MGDALNRFSLRGDTGELARLSVILACLLAAVVVAWWSGGFEWRTLVGSFLGGALSTTLAWTIATLEKERERLAPTEFHLAAEIEISAPRYYRERETVEISVCEIDSEFVRVDFTFHSIVRVKTGETADVWHPIFENLPYGLTVIDSEYVAGGNSVGKGGQSTEISGNTEIRHTIRYKLRRDVEEISDTHLFPSAVLSYVVKFTEALGYTLQVDQVTGRKIKRQLTGRRQKGRVTFESLRAAFSSQGITWRLRKNAGEIDAVS